MDWLICLVLSVLSQMSDLHCARSADLMRGFSMDWLICLVLSVLSQMSDLHCCFGIFRV